MGYKIMRWMALVFLFAPELAMAQNYYPSTSGPQQSVPLSLNGVLAGGIGVPVSSANPLPVVGGGSATSPSYQKPAPYTNTGGDITGQSVTTAFSPSCPAGSTSIQIEPYGGAINVRTDGTTATAAAPVIEYQALTAVTLSPTPLSNISIIAVSGTGTTIGAECLK